MVRAMNPSLVPLTRYRNLLFIAVILITVLGLLFQHQYRLKESVSSAQPDIISVTYLRLLLKLYPDDATLRLELARQLRNLGRLEEAQKNLEPLLTQLDPAAVQARLLSLEIQLAQFYSEAAPPEAADPNRQAQLLTLRRALETLLEDQLSIAEFVHVAKVSLELGMPDLAAKLYVRLAEVDLADRPSWLATAGQWYLAAGQPEQASYCYDQVAIMAQNSEQARSYALLALDAALAANQPAAGLQLARSFLERFPQDRELLDKVIAMALAHNDTVQALQWGYQRLALDPEDPKQVIRQADLALAAGDLPAAMELAQRYVSLQPENHAARERLAQIAEWAGRPDLALEQWAWLARRNPESAALESALGLARGLPNDSIRLEMLTLRSRVRPLNSAELSEVLYTYNSRRKDLASATAFLTVYLKRYPQERNGWEALAQLQERNGDLIAAAATWEYMGAHFGNRVAATCRQAELLWRASQREQAFSLLQRIQPQANLSDSTYWKLFGDLAWNLKRNADALNAYRILWKAGQADALGAERLIILARDAGHHNEAITTAELAFQRFSQPRLLLLGMDVAIRANLWQALAHSIEIARQKEQQFQSNEMYWLQRAQLSVHNGRSEEARENYERALQINPKSVSARVSLLWLMIRSDDKLRLSEYITRWQRDALADSSLWGAYAAAFVKLGRAREALPWFERYLHASPRDYSSLLSYADALTQVGQVEAAWRLRQHTLQQLRAEVKRGSLKLADSK